MTSSQTRVLETTMLADADNAHQDPPGATEITQIQNAATPAPSTAKLGPIAAAYEICHPQRCIIYLGIWYRPPSWCWKPHKTHDGWREWQHQAWRGRRWQGRGVVYSGAGPWHFLGKGSLARRALMDDAGGRERSSGVVGQRSGCWRRMTTTSSGSFSCAWRTWGRT